MPRLCSRCFLLVLFFLPTNLILLSKARAVDPKYLLFYGNSFTNACCGATGSLRPMPTVVAEIAQAAGHPKPYVKNAAVNGQSMQWHVDNNTFAITSGIPGQHWSNVVLQDFSTQPTHIGNLALHLSSTTAMYNLVAAHSPNVVPVLFETWARGPGHSFYTGVNPSFPGGPVQMQQELRDGYHMAVDNINSMVGSNLAKYAPAGDAWENAGFPLNFYASDIYHANNRGMLLNALIMYGTIYDDRTTSDINLSAILATLNVSAADGQFLQSLADATLVPEPTTLAMVGFGVLLMTRRRRRLD